MYLGLWQVIDENHLCQLPTWNAFNSLLSNTPTVTVSQGLPFYPGLSLYLALKIVLGMNVLLQGITT